MRASKLLLFWERLLDARMSSQNFLYVRPCSSAEAVSPQARDTLGMGDSSLQSLAKGTKWIGPTPRQTPLWSHIVLCRVALSRPRKEPTPSGKSTEQEPKSSAPLSFFGPPCIQSAIPAETQLHHLLTSTWPRVSGEGEVVGGHKWRAADLAMLVRNPRY